MKRKTAKQILADSFRELAKDRPIDKITIQEIADNCGYSPATFYRNYRDKYDLIVWDYAQGTERIMERIGKGGYAWRQTLLDGARRYGQERGYLANLITHTAGHDAFIRYMTEINFDALRTHILANSGREALDEQTEMLIRAYCHGTVNLTCEWILGRYSASPEALAEIYVQALLEALNLTCTQYLVMMVLWQYGSMTEGELGRKVHLDSGTLAPLLKRWKRWAILRAAGRKAMKER